MYRARLWTMRQYCGYGDVAETRRRFLYLLDQGQTGLSVAFDLPTQLGYDSDSEIARGEVGRVGVAIDSLADLEVLFQNIPLAQVSVSMTINAPAAVLFAMFLVVAQKQGLQNDQIKGTLQNDILKEYIARGTQIFPIQPSMRLVTDILQYSIQNCPNWNPISISGYHMREAGCTAAQEIAFTFGNAIAYIDQAVSRNIAVDELAPRLSFFFSAHNHFLEEIAKFRAARRLWAFIMRDRFGAVNPKSMMLRFHTQTAGCTLTAQQPENNIVRVTLQALAAVLGGTQSLHTNSHDEALNIPSARAVSLALRTQQVIAYESGVADAVDPLGGSFYLEELTDRLEIAAKEIIENVDKLGGMENAIAAGYVQREIQNASLREQLAIETKQQLRVGINAFQSGRARDARFKFPVFDIEQRQIERLQNLKQTRDAALVAMRLEQLAHAAAGSDNLMPFIMDAVSAYCTIGEICDVLRRCWGEYHEEERV